MWKIRTLVFHRFTIGSLIQMSFKALRCLCRLRLDSDSKLYHLHKVRYGSAPLSPLQEIKSLISSM